MRALRTNKCLLAIGVFGLVGLYLAVMVSVPHQHRHWPFPGGSRMQNGTGAPKDNEHSMAVLRQDVTVHDGVRVIDFYCAARWWRDPGGKDPLPPPPDAPAALFEWALAANDALLVLNEDVFGTLADRPPSRVIVVQVHRRPRYARWLLQSLSLVPGIESALLVLSHGHVDEALLGLARDVCFCRVVRVFFPWSAQMWDDQFPGIDCVNGTSVLGGKPCSRDPTATVAKHHWWWLHNFVFGNVIDAVNYTGVVLFLEEDQYLSPDALHVLDGMRRAVPAADMFVLNDNRGVLSKAQGARVLKSHWVYNMGLALDARAWAKVVRCAAVFCAHNDYNWDWSLQLVGASCVPGQFNTAVMRGSRVFHIGNCGGMHFHAGADCDALALKAKSVLLQMGDVLFPETLAVDTVPARATAGRPNGGWADPRDHQLCLDNVLQASRRRPARRRPGYLNRENSTSFSLFLKHK